MANHRRANLDTLARYHVEGECWVWDGPATRDGYGQVSRERGFSTRAHRYFYQKIIGAIPPGMHLDHRCRRRLCVNPEHLEPVSPGENIRRGLMGFGLGKCRAGLHDVTTPGSVRVKSDGDRQCVECRRAYIRSYMAAYRQCQIYKAS